MIQRATALDPRDGETYATEDQHTPAGNADFRSCAYLGFPMDTISRFSLRNGRPPPSPCPYALQRAPQLPTAELVCDW